MIRSATLLSNRRAMARASFILLIVAATLLTGCGRKGDPEPPDQGSAYPQTYPAN